MKRTLCTLLTLVTFVPYSHSQVATGVLPFNSYGGGPFDAVNLGNLNVHFTIPIIHKAGRGTPFTYDLNYDNSIYRPVVSGGTTQWQPVTTIGNIASYWGWQGLGPTFSPYVGYKMTYTSGMCGQYGNQPWSEYGYSNFIYYDKTGSSHAFNAGGVDYNSPGGNNCPPNGPQPPTSQAYTATDGSGFVLNMAPGWGSASGNVQSKDGTTINSAWLTSPPTGSSPYSQTDRNGNQITYNNGIYTDTLGKNVLQINGASPNPVTFAYVPPSGTSANPPSTVSITANFVNYTVKTNFGATDSGGHPIAEYSSSSPVALVDNITFPDGTRYAFQYEATPSVPASGACTPLPNTAGCVTGRIWIVTLPTGGTITYTYPGGANGIINDGSAAGLKRVLSSPGGTWLYTRSQVSGTHWQTTVASPTGDNTISDFMEDSTTGSAATYSFYETERQIKQLINGTQTLLATAITCYNTASPTPSNCPTTSVSSPISRLTAFSYLPDTSASSKVAETDTQFNSLGDPTEVDSYDYGTGSPPTTPLKKVITSYLVNATFPVIITVEDGSNNTKAYSTFLYDQTTPTVTTSPQHTTVNNWGNLTTLSEQISGSRTLYRRFTHYDTGTLKTETDWGTTTAGGPHTTTYNYSSSSCGNSLPTSISEPLGLTRSFTWDCYGGVQTSVTDENGQSSTTYYAQTSSYGSPDPNYWRPYALTDAVGNATTMSYPNNSVVESALAFNSGHSVVDRRTKSNSLGLPVLSEVEEGPSLTTYDSTQTDYDPLLRISKAYLPFQNGTDATCTGTCPGVTYGYDALNRTTSISDAGTGSLTKQYTTNDVLQTIGPAPNAENPNGRQKQFEYDGLGRLTSVCELTSTANGGGTCGQTNQQTGFWTKYSYDLLGNIIGVTQNAQAAGANQQTRTFAYDEIGRLTSEQNPETGTTAITYTYDTADANCGSYSSPGDLVEKKDAMGNYTCFRYDALHRVTQITYPVGTYKSPTTPTKCFVFATPSSPVTVNGFTMQNAKLAVAEAYTTTASSCPGTPSVDEGFSYTARGELADVWEKTPDSGGYYHVNATYWAHGALDVLNGGTSPAPLPGLPAITYGASDGSGLDGKGRFTKVTAASGQNPVSCTTAPCVSYNVADQITGVTFGSADNDAFQYDTSTNRITQYKFNMGTGPQSQTGALTWNPNGSLQKLVITDQINTANSQTCKFGDPSASVPGYDDLGRLIKADCASAWSQTFAFDPFGNLSKSGSAQFLPTYTGATGTGTSPTNQYYQIPGGSTGTSNYYDTNGNLKSDLTHTYTWDADGNMLSVDGSTVALIYDAMDRMVEQTRGASHTELMYSPTGRKLALMNGQTLVNAFVGLPGGATAVYNNSGLAYYRHSDHLGSSRLATTPSRTKYFDVAYAPFGEDYNQSGTTDLSFTSQNQDTVSGGWPSNLYDFLMREYRTGHGRWTSPDPAGSDAVDPTSPQTWNRYAYVINNPLALKDPSGMDFCSGNSPYTAGGGSSGSLQVYCYGPPFLTGVENYYNWFEGMQAMVNGTNSIFGEEPDLINVPLGSGNPFNDLWQALGLPTIPCGGTNMSGPWCTSDPLIDPTRDWGLGPTCPAGNKAPCVDDPIASETKAFHRCLDEETSFHWKDVGETAWKVFKSCGYHCKDVDPGNELENETERGANAFKKCFEEHPLAELSPNTVDPNPFPWAWW